MEPFWLLEARFSGWMRFLYLYYYYFFFADLGLGHVDAQVGRAPAPRVHHPGRAAHLPLWRLGSQHERLFSGCRCRILPRFP